MSDYFLMIKDALAERAFGPKFWGDFASSAIAAIAGAGFGAWIGARSAFKLERHKAHDERILAAGRAKLALDEQRAAAGNLAMLSLALIYNDLIVIDNQALTPAKKTIAPWFYMVPLDVDPNNHHAVDIPSLAFLLQSSEPEIVAKLALEPDRYRTLLNAIQLRSTYHQEHVLDAIEHMKAIDPNKTRYTAEELQHVVSDRVFVVLSNYTSDIYTLWELGMKTCKRTGDELRKVLAEVLPGYKIIGFDIAVNVAGQGSPVIKARDQLAKLREKPPG